MSVPTQTYQYEIPASQLEDASAFEASRAEAYAESDVAERRASLSELLNTSQVVGGVILSEVLLERLTHSDEHAELAKDRLSEISEMIVKDSIAPSHTAETYAFTLDENGEVQEVMHILPVAEDRLATSRNRRVAESIGWGPKQNSVSGVYGVPNKRDIPKNKKKA